MSTPPREIGGEVMLKKPTVQEEVTHRPGFWRKNWANFIGAGLSGLVVARMFFITTTSAASTVKEAEYQSIILTAASVLASWFLAKIHEQYTQDQNLRSLGAQVAQGIIVLSSQIDTLVQWLANERDSGGVGAHSGALDHIEQSLKSLKPLSILALGGVGDFIGDPLKRYARVQSQIGELLDEQIQQQDVLTGKLGRAESAQEVENLRQQLKVTKDTFDRQVAKLTNELPIPIPMDAHQRRVPCPYCDAVTVVRIRLHPGATAPSTCSKCDRKFNTHVTARGVIFSRRVSHERYEQTLPPGQRVRPELAVVRSALMSRQALLSPEEVYVLVDLVVCLNEEASSSGRKFTPADLHDHLVEEVFKENSVRHVQARRFFSLIYHGRLFKFATGVRPSWTTHYINALDRETILQTYTSSCLWRIWGRFSFAADHAPLVAEVLFGTAEPEALDFATRAIEELLRLRAPTLGVASTTAEASTVTALQTPEPSTNASLEPPENLKGASSQDH